MGRRFRARGAVLAVIVGLGVAGAVGSTAAAATSLATSCVKATGKPFLPWLDVAFYGLTPGGSFESRSNWSLGTGAKVVSGNEPFRVGAATDQHSLVLSSGSTASTGPVCVGLGDPTVRLFALARTRGAWLRIDAVGRTLLGQVVLPVASIPAPTVWAPTVPLPFLSGLAGLTSLDGTTTSVQFRFTAVGGSVQIDDVYLDPWKVH